MAAIVNDEKWEVEGAADTIIRAQGIKADKKLWPKVQKELVRKAEAAKRAVAESRAQKGLKKAFPED